MKRIRELLKEKRWRWTAGGVACLLVAALMFGMLSELGVKADEISLGNDTIDLHPVEGEENTYWLENASQLQKLGNAVSGTEGLTFRLKNDIAMGSIKSPATGNFAGVLDGNGYVITYEDIDIVVTDEVASSDSVENGLMFGSVSGTIQNLVIDIQDTDASYTRKTKNPYNELVGSPVFAEEQNPIIGENEVVSGLSSDMAELQKGGAIHALDTVAGTDYKSHTLSEAGTVTTIYTAGDSSEDYFGLICGKNTGTIQQVYLTGNSVAVQREELAALDYSKSVQSGYREETYYYLQEIDSSTGEAETAQLSIDGTVYAGNETYTEELKDQELVVSVSAPKAAAKGEMITYQITVKNDSDEAYTGVSVLAAADGTEIWQHSFSGEIGAGDTAEAEFSYDTSGLDPEEISVDFTVEGTSGSTAASVTVSDVQTVLFDAAESAFSGSVQGLKLHVSAPEKAGMGDEIGYTVQVTNHADETYSKVLLESVLSGTWEDADQNTAFTGNPEIELASQETRTFTFIYDTGSLSSAETAVTADFTATAVTASETESAKAVVNGLETELVKTVDGVYENSVLGLGMKITAPQAKGVNGTAAIQYEIQISNTSDTAYTGLKVTASEAGAWSSADSSGAGQASTVYELDELAPQTSETITFTYTTTADDLTAAKALLDFKVSGKKDGAEAEVRVSDVETELFDVNSTTEGSSDAELEVKILAPKSVKQGEEVTYAVTVLNLSDKAFDKVVLEADTAGEWTEGAELSSLEPGVEQTVHFTVKNTAAVSNALAVNFTAVGTRTVIIESDTTDPDAAEGSDTATETETQEETVIVKVTNVTTRLFSEAEFSKEEALDGLEIKVLAPQEKVTNWRRTIQYQIVVTNHGEETYEKVKLTASESGRWNGSLFKSATEFEIDGLSAGDRKSVV